MISCTEFIPAYSELFSFLDENYGRDEVSRFWDYLFKPDGKGIPLINFAKKDGLRGCWNYWTGTLSEEAADCTRYFNEKQGWISSEMHYCPSKGRLLELQKEIGLVPYYDYCDHCNYYRAALEAVGFRYIRNILHVDKAACSSMIYDPKRFPGVIKPDADTEVMEISSKDKEYFHPDFHSSLNMGLEYTGSVHGEEALKKYLTRYTKNVYIKTIEAMANGTLPALEALIAGTYRAEHAEDAITLENDGKTLSVTAHYCPAVKHLRATGREVSRFFPLATSVVMQTLAELGGVRFEMLAYDADTGAAKYAFYA